MFRAARAALIAVAMWGFAQSAAASTVRPLVLDELVEGAAIAFHGRCTGNRVEIDAQTRLVVTFTTFEVTEAIKGPVASTHVIKQIGGILPGGDSGMIVHGVPKFAVGQEVVLFLAGVSAWGFSSPVGLGQGRFDVAEGPAGKVVQLGRPLRTLAARASRTPEGSGNEDTREMGVADFKALVRSRMESRMEVRE